MPAPVIQLTIMAAEGLKNVALLGGKMDPYVVAFVNPHRKFSTRVLHRGGKDPVWNDSMEIPLEIRLFDEAGASLTFQVLHQSSISSSIAGATTLLLQDLLRNAALKASGEGDILTLQLFRPSGRPHGILRVFLKISGDGLPSLSQLFGGEICDAPATGIPVMQVQNGMGYHTDKCSYAYQGNMPDPKFPLTTNSEPSSLPYQTPPSTHTRGSNNFLVGVISGVVAAVLLGALI